MVAQACNPRTWEAVEDGSVRSRSMQEVYSKIQSRKEMRKEGMPH